MGFFKKKYWKKALVLSNIPVINLIVGSRNMIGIYFSPNTDSFLAFFIVFEWGRISESAMDK